MKKILSICLMTSLLGLQFSSCSRKDDEPSLVGTWVSTSANNKIYVSSMLTLDSNYSMAGQEIVVMFNADKTYSGWSDKEWDKETGTYSIDGKNLVLYANGDFDSLKYKLTKDEFTTINEGYLESDSSRYEIETITYKRK